MCIGSIWLSMYRRWFADSSMWKHSLLIWICMLCRKPEICTGTWTEWASSSDAVCNDTCGNCGTMPTYRYCFPSGCQCTGAYNGVKACANSDS
uniref:ShKT domain-containing protein n=1 Tax=Caenorhabditis japonica TaxID=281687 RepID=A0A8R1DQ53_CAEJA